MFPQVTLVGAGGVGQYVGGGHAPAEDIEVVQVDVAVIVQDRVLAERCRLGCACSRETGLQVAEVRLVNVAVAVEVAGDGRGAAGRIHRGPGHRPRALVAGITYAVAVGIILISIGDHRAVVLGVGHAVTIVVTHRIILELIRPHIDHGHVIRRIRHPLVDDARIVHQFTLDRQVKHVSRVLREALNPLDWGERVAVMRCLMERLALHLDEDTDLAAPERYVGHLDLIVRAYVQSLDSIQTRFRAM